MLYTCPRYAGSRLSSSARGRRGRLGAPGGGPGPAGPRGPSRVMRAALTTFARLKTARTLMRCRRGPRGTHFPEGPPTDLRPQVTLTLGWGHLCLYRPGCSAHRISYAVALLGARAYLNAVGARGAAPGKIGQCGAGPPFLRVALFSRRHPAGMRGSAPRAVEPPAYVPPALYYFATPVGADSAPHTLHP